ARSEHHRKHRPCVGGTTCARAIRGRPVLDLLLLPVATLDRRHARRLRRRGAALIIAFMVVRALNVYGDPHPWHFDASNTAASVMSFLGTTKYPPSLLYILMTLGPAAIACAYAERLQGPIRHVLVTFGRAPLAFYVAHLYLIHTLALLLGVAQGFSAQQFLTHYRQFPKGYG